MPSSLQGLHLQLDKGEAEQTSGFQRLQIPRMAGLGVTEGASPGCFQQKGWFSTSLCLGFSFCEMDRSFPQLRIQGSNEVDRE